MSRSVPDSSALLSVAYCLNSSDPQSSLTLAKDDVVKLHLGAHIDGFASISAETIIVGASEQEPATGRRADVVKAAWHAAELAMRLVKVENKNWAVTEGVSKVISAWDCKAVEGTPLCVLQPFFFFEQAPFRQGCYHASTQKTLLMARKGLSLDLHKSSGQTWIQLLLPKARFTGWMSWFPLGKMGRQVVVICF